MKSKFLLSCAYVLVTANAIDLAGGSDTLTLANGSNVATLANVESILLSGTATANSLTFTTSQAGGVVTGTTRTDDALVLAAGGNSISAANIERITGGSGADTVTLSTTIAGASIDLGSGTTNANCP